MSHETLLAKITDTFIGYEGHGIFSISLQLDYGHSGQGFGHYGASVEIIEAIINACGANSWEQVKGRTVFAVRDEGWGGLVRGLTPLPTERGTGFVIERDGAVKPYG